MSSFRALRRRRELQGDRRAGTYAREKAIRARYEFARRAWWVLLVGAGILCAPGLVIASLAGGNQLVQGLALGATLAGVPVFLWSFVGQATGATSVAMGDIAEQWTAQDLRRLTRHGWRLINHVPLEYGDVDHLLIGPGGVFVFETKWSAGDWRTEVGKRTVTSASSRASRDAARLQRWNAIRPHSTPVVPVVVLWGGNSRTWPPEHHRVHWRGTELITGHSLRPWLDTLRGLPRVLDETAIDAVWEGVSRYLLSRDDYEQQQRPAPISPGRALVHASLLACAALVAIPVAAGVAQVVLQA